MTETPQGSPRISRRSIAKGAAWAAPVVIASQAAAAHATSPSDPAEATICRLYNGKGNVNNQTHSVYLSLTNSTQKLTAGTKFYWDFDFAGGQATIATKNSSANFNWKLDYEQRNTPSPIKKLTAILTIAKDGTADELGLTCDANVPQVIWTSGGNKYLIAPMETVTIKARGKGGDSSVETASLKYRVPLRDGDKNSGKTMPLVYLEKGGNLTCWPGVQWSRLNKQDTSAYDTQTCFGENATNCVSPDSMTGPNGDWFTHFSC